jgi:hypothetical protein
LLQYDKAYEREEIPMSQVLEVDAEGALYLPRELLGDVKPHARFVLEVHGDTLILRPVRSHPFWETASPDERAEAFVQWARRHTTGPGLPDEAISREHIYDR